MTNPIDDIGSRMIIDVCEEVYRLCKAGEIKAIVVGIVKADGDARTLNAFKYGEKFPLLATATLAQHALLHQIEKGSEPVDKPDKTN